MGIQCTSRCTRPVSVVLRLRLVSGWGLVNGDHGFLRLGKGLYFFTTKMNDFDLCLEVVSRSYQSLRYIWRWMHRKPLEIEAWFQRTTNRKWHTGFQMVTWPMTSRDAQRCCEAVRSAILAIAWLLVLNRLKQGVAKLSPQFVIILFETRCTCTHVGLCTDVCMNGFITIGNLQIAKKVKNAPSNSSYKLSIHTWR